MTDRPVRRVAKPEPERPVRKVNRQALVNAVAAVVVEAISVEKDERSVRKVTRPVLNAQERVNAAACADVNAAVAAEKDEVQRVRVCPTCSSTNTTLIGVVGTLPEPGTGKAELVVTRQCLGCSGTWETRKPRQDVCPHGILVIVPCKSCGTTWESIMHRWPRWPNRTPEIAPGEERDADVPY